MKWLFKWIFRLVLLAAVLIVALVLAKDAIIRGTVERQIRAQAGMDVKIGKFSVGLLSPVVTIENFKLYNTTEFGGAPFLDIRELHLEYDRAALAGRKLHVTLLRLDLAELNVVKNDTGRTNLVTLQSQPQPAARVDEIQFAGIDVLNLSVGKVHFLDLKDQRLNREFRPNMQNQIFKNVRTSGDFFGVLAFIWMRSGGGFMGLTANPPTLAAISDFDFGR